jgi:hypothetical protein
MRKRGDLLSPRFFIGASIDSETIRGWPRDMKRGV